ncbi:nucleotidyltransferase family protein [uncultured Methylophaga sp.]|uniref:nucleotidyltransferase family protein n=1 Tax=uncultured Methylophaga sp. TaxID=285271 RepID=UPI00260F1560|nr:nucleotidyltransferase family protein [uncultured Methylophaga sp.]
MAAQSICPILLAAGQARRFGSDKLLHVLSYQDECKPLILHALKPWLEVFSQVNVVIRADNTALLDLLNQSPFSSRLTLITAEDAHQGMAASLVSGIKANQQADGWLIGLADMPFIQSSVIEESQALLQDGAVITQPEYKGRRGHPVGFAAAFLPQLLPLNGDKGARDILSASASRISHISSPDDGIYRDIDMVDDTAVV